MRLGRSLSVLGLALTPILGLTAISEASPSESDLAAAPHAPRLLVIVGAPGEEKYRDRFREAASVWENLAEQANSQATFIGLEPEESDPDRSDKQRIQEWITALPSSPSSRTWVVYLGHGNYDGRHAKLNLRGPDLSASELQNAFSEYSGRLAFIHGGSASAPFLPALSGPKRIIITATKSENESNYARFGEFFAKAMADSSSDLDLDGEVSLLEAFVTASERVETHYLEAGRLTSEHALLDDNGDGLGVTYDSFAHLAPIAAPDGEVADGQSARRTPFVPSKATLALSPTELERRDALEDELENLRARKDDLSEAEYFEELEAIFVQLSKLYLKPSRAPANADDS